MDTISMLLDGPRAQGAFLLQSVLDPPWSLRIEDGAPLTLVAVVRGQAVVVPEEGSPQRLAPGEVAIARGPAPYTVADDAATPPQVIVLPGQRCVAADGAGESPMSLHGPRTWGARPNGSTALLTGTYQTDGAVSDRLLRALPPLLAVREEIRGSALVPLLAEEIVRDLPGQAAVLDRLLDLLLISVLRAWFARPEAEAPAWYRAYSDPTVGTTLRLMENDCARPWTLASLAEASHVSRATLARRFLETVGEPPMTYLTRWRMEQAADLLLDVDATVSGVALRVGYGSAFAFSTAFKRIRGLSPREHRRSALSGTAPAAVTASVT